MSPVTPKSVDPGEDFFAWRGRQEGRQGRRPGAGLSGEPPVLQPAPLPRTADDRIDVVEHAASTTIVRQIREGLAKLLSRE